MCFAYILLGSDILFLTVLTTLIKSIGITLVTFGNMFNLIILVYLLLGIGIGIIGSSLSMKKYLEV